MMTTSDLFVDGFPHGTPDGYEQGCQSGVCPAGMEHGLSCKIARMKSRGDYQYQKLVKEGASIPEIADALGLIGTDPSTPKPKSPRPTPPTPAALKIEAVPPFVDGALTETPDAMTAKMQEAIAATPTQIPESYVHESSRSREIWDETTKRINEASDSAPADLVTAHAETTPTPPTPVEIRAWARQWGYEVNAKGKIPQHIRDLYDNAHADGTPTTLTEAITANLTTTEPAVDSPAPETDTTSTNEDTTPDRPDWALVTLTQDHATALAERDSARNTAIRLEQELAHVTEAATAEATALCQEVLNEVSLRNRAEEQLAHAKAELPGRLALLAQLATAQEALTEEREARALAARNLEFAIRKWAEEADDNRATYAVILDQATTINDLHQQLANRPHLINDQRLTYTPSGLTEVATMATLAASAASASAETVPTAPSKPRSWLRRR